MAKKAPLKPDSDTGTAPAVPFEAVTTGDSVDAVDVMDAAPVVVSAADEGIRAPAKKLPGCRAVSLKEARALRR